MVGDGDKLCDGLVRDLEHHVAGCMLLSLQWLLRWRRNQEQNDMVQLPIACQAVLDTGGKGSCSAALDPKSENCSVALVHLTFDCSNVETKIWEASLSSNMPLLAEANQIVWRSVNTIIRVIAQRPLEVMSFTSMVQNFHGCISKQSICQRTNTFISQLTMQQTQYSQRSIHLQCWMKCTDSIDTQSIIVKIQSLQLKHVQQ
jgi:hypothetical protein